MEFFAKIDTGSWNGTLLRNVNVSYKLKFSAGIYMFQVNNRNTSAMCKTYSKLKLKTSERRHLSCSDVFIVKFEHVSHIALVFSLLTFNK